MNNYNYEYQYGCAFGTMSKIVPPGLPMGTSSYFGDFKPFVEAEEKIKKDNKPLTLDEIKKKYYGDK